MVNEYLINKSYVNYKDRFYPKETTDLLTNKWRKNAKFIINSK